MTRGVLLSMAAVMASVGATPAAAADEPVAVAVLNFANQVQGPAGQEWDWLEKGLADLVINDLSQRPGLQLVSREQMQLAITRMLHKGGMLPEWQEKISKQLKAARAVVGTYRVDGGKVVIRATVLDVLEDRPVATAVVTGRARDVLKLEKQLAAKVLKILTGQADAAEFVMKLPLWTDSVPATKLLYQGVDLFDCGRYEQAWLHFRRALRQDPTYADARYWAARMFYYQLRYEHAMTELESFVREFPGHSRAGDGLMESADALLLTSASIPQAVAYCRRILPRSRDIHVYCPAVGLGHVRMKAATYLHLCLGDLYHQLGNTRASAEHLYQAWLDTALPDESRSQIRYFFSRAVHRLQEVPPMCRGEIIRVTPDRPWHEGTFQASASVGMAEKYHLGWFQCDEDHFIDALTMSVSSKHEMPFWLQNVVPAQVRSKRPTLNKTSGRWEATITFRPPAMTRHLQLAGAGTMTDWVAGSPYRIDFELLPTSRATARLHVEVRPEGTAVRVALHGRAPKKVPLGRTVSLAPESSRACLCIDEQFWHHLYKTPLWRDVMLREGQLTRVTFDLSRSRKDTCWQAAVRVPIAAAEPILFRGLTKGAQSGPGSLRAEGEGIAAHDPQSLLPGLLVGKGGRLVTYAALFGDIWLSTSGDEGASWTAFSRPPRPVNSAHWEGSPCLILDDRGRYCLTFLSDRNILRRYWPYASVSDDLVTWSRPAKVSEVESGAVNLIQDARGEYLLTQGTTRGVLVTRSPDCLAWQEPSIVWPSQDGGKPAEKLEGSVPQASLFQWPDGSYQLIMIRYQSVQELDPGGGCVMYGTPMLYTGNSRDLASWTHWHLLTAPERTDTARWGWPCSFPGYCFIPGAGLVLYGSFHDRAWARAADKACWVRCPDVRHVHRARQAMARTPKGTVVSVHADYSSSERLPHFCAFVSDHAADWLKKRKWTRMPRQEPLRGWLIIHREPKTKPASRPAAKP